jgi:GNAT superfamily N-acetyltransferase
VSSQAWHRSAARREIGNHVAVDPRPVSPLPMAARMNDADPNQPDPHRPDPNLAAASDAAAIEIDSDPTRLDRALIHRVLADSYWARQIPRPLLDRALDHSLCFGAYLHGRQVGFARVISDCATFAYLADVFVLEDQRGRGIARRLLAAVDAHPQLQGLRRWLLATRDAHALYAGCGYRPLASPEHLMERHDPQIYQRAAAAPD